MQEDHDEVYASIVRRKITDIICAHGLAYKVLRGSLRGECGIICSHIM